MSWRAPLFTGCIVFIAACAGNGDDSAGVTVITQIAPSTASTSPESRSAGTEASPDGTVAPPSAPSTTVAPTTIAPRPGNPTVASELVATFNAPVDLTSRAGDDAVYVVEQGGRILRYDGAQRVVLDIASEVSSANEQGLLGVAFAADGATGYINFTDLDGDTVVDEFTVDDDGTFDPASRRTIIVVDQPFPNHNGGDLAIGPDGLLYIALGDGGSAGDPNRDASNTSTLLGSIVRLDPTPSDEQAYTIPESNPFADRDDAAPELWAWGLRNPWKIAFDQVTGDLWIADVGQNSVEEVNHVPFIAGTGSGWGVNFGWSAFEGAERFNTDVPDEGATPPVLTYRHDVGCSISGGVPYRGSAIPELEPAYVYSDFCSGDIWAFDLVGERNLTLLTGFATVSAVRADASGELYVLELSGDVHRLIAG